MVCRLYRSTGLADILRRSRILWFMLYRTTEPSFIEPATWVDGLHRTAPKPILRKREATLGSEPNSSVATTGSQQAYRWVDRLSTFCVNQIRSGLFSDLEEIQSKERLSVESELRRIKKIQKCFSAFAYHAFTYEQVEQSALPFPVCQFTLQTWKDNKRGHVLLQGIANILGQSTSRYFELLCVLRFCTKDILLQMQAYLPWGAEPFLLHCPLYRTKKSI